MAILAARINVLAAEIADKTANTKNVTTYNN